MVGTVHLVSVEVAPGSCNHAHGAIEVIGTASQCRSIDGASGCASQNGEGIAFGFGATGNTDVGNGL
jgi:hypothetical protein